MSQALLLARREIRAYFRSPLGSVVIASSLLLEGILFYWRSLSQKLLSGEALKLGLPPLDGRAAVVLRLREPGQLFESCGQRRRVLEQCLDVAPDGRVELLDLLLADWRGPRTLACLPGEFGPNLLTMARHRFEVRLLPVDESAVAQASEDR